MSDLTQRYHFRGGADQHFHELDGAFANSIDAVENEAAGGGVDQIDHVVQPAAELVNILTVERGNESLIELGQDGVGDVVALVLDGFDALHLLGHARCSASSICRRALAPAMNILGLLVEQVEESPLRAAASRCKSPGMSDDSPLKSL